MTALNLLIDAGSTETKIIFRIDNGKPLPLCMGPEAIALPRDIVEHQARQCVEGCHPAFRAWVTAIKKKLSSSQAIAVGSLARQLEATPTYRAPKPEAIPHKVAVAIGVIAEYYQLKDEIALELSVVLPFDTYKGVKGTSEGRSFLKRLRKECGRFYFGGQRKVECKVGQVAFFPEGFGTAYLSERRQGFIEDMSNLVVFVGGHRNTSLGYRREGSWDGCTSDWGFRKLLARVVEQVALPAHSEAALAQAIWEMGDRPNLNHRKLIEIATAITDRAARSEEIRNNIISAAHTARAYYWQSVERWLREHFPGSCQRVVISGGGGNYLYSELNDFCGEIPLDNISHCFDEIASFLKEGSEGSASIDSVRFADVYGLSQLLIA